MHLFYEHERTELMFVYQKLNIPYGYLNGG
jgi:hypothetical protein